MSSAISKPIPGVPEECPPIIYYFNADHRPRLIGFRFPQVPGVPDVVDSPSRRFRAAMADGLGIPGSVTAAEWRSSLSTVGGEFDRADYHLSRFHDVLGVIKARRNVVGGPSAGDFSTARALYCEASAYLIAVRTAIDIIVYVAARRAGKSEKDADGWSATEAIAPKPEKKLAAYETEDIGALRPHREWFEKLNLYRNCMAHRGWHEQSFGYFSKVDTAPESNDPVHNVMLVPDFASLKRSRPDKWTYTDRTWLDELVAEVAAGVALSIEALCNVWGLPDPSPGTIPAEENPNMLLTVPRAVALADQPPPALHIFASKTAVRAFLEHFKKHTQRFPGLFYRVVRQTKLAGNDAGFLIAYDEDVFGEKPELHFMDVELGQPRIVTKARFSPADSTGLPRNLIWVRMPELASEVVYILDLEPECEDGAVSDS